MSPLKTVILSLPPRLRVPCWSSCVHRDRRPDPTVSGAHTPRFFSIFQKYFVLFLCVLSLAARKSLLVLPPLRQVGVGVRRDRRDCRESAGREPSSPPIAWDIRRSVYKKVSGAYKEKKSVFLQVVCPAHSPVCSTLRIAQRSWGFQQFSCGACGVGVVWCGMVHVVGWGSGARVVDEVSEGGVRWLELRALTAWGEKDVEQSGGAGSDAPVPSSWWQELEETVGGMGGVLHNTGSFTGASCKENVQDGGERGTDDLCSCVHCPL